MAGTWDETNARPTDGTAAVQDATQLAEQELARRDRTLRVFRLSSLMLVAIVVVAVGLANSSVRYGLIISTIYAIAVLGNNAVTGALGQINLGMGAFIAFGAYLTADLTQHGVGVIYAVLVAMVGSAIVAAVFAIPMTRLSGISTAMVTFALAYLVSDLATYLSSVTGGIDGEFLPSDFRIGGLILAGTEPGMLIAAVIVMVVVGVAQFALWNSRPGLLAVSVGEAETAAAVYGVRVRLVKVLVWTWAGLLAGLCGALYGLAVGYVGAEQWPFTLSLFIFAGGLVGGTRSVTGAWLGGIIVGGLPLWLQNVVPATSTSIAYGVILLLALASGGRGVAPMVERRALRVLRRSARPHR